MIIFGNMHCIHRLVIKTRLTSYLTGHLPAHRRIHSIEVAKLAKKLCVHYNRDPYKGVIAGLGHDIARELDPKDIMKYAAKDGRPVSHAEKQNPLVLHGRAGAFILQHKFGIADHEILEAVRNHVTGEAGMGVLSKIIFVADFLEPKRGFLEDDYRRRLLSLPLDSIMVRIFELIFKFLREHNCWISETSLQLYNGLKESLAACEKI